MAHRRLRIVGDVEARPLLEAQPAVRRRRGDPRARGVRELVVVRVESDLADSPVLKNVIANDALKGKDRQILKIKVEAAKAVLNFFASDYGKKFAARMAVMGIDPAAEKAAAVRTEGPLVGAGCVLTGTLSRPRGEYAKLIEAAGGIVQSAVTSKTRYLIAGANVGATKTEKARALGTEVIDEARLLELLR